MHHLTLIRHGYRSDWERSPSRVRYPLDPALADIGRQQADRTAAQLIQDGEPPVTNVRCSPFRRCLETADPIARACRCDIIPDWRLGEVIPPESVSDGWEEDMDPNYLPQRIGAIGKAMYPEDPLMVEKRVRSLWVELNRTMEDGNHLVLVSHEGILIGLANLLTQKELYIDWRPCGLTRLSRSGRSARRWTMQGDPARIGHLGDTYRDPPTITSSLRREAGL